MEFKSLVAPVSAPFSFAIFGTVTVTIGNGVGRGTANVTISPALTDSTLSNYACFATVNDAAQAFSSDVRLTSTVLLSVAAYRYPNLSTGTTGNASTGVSVAGNDLTDVSGMATDPVSETVSGAHGADGGFFGHGHTTTGHPVTDPQHSHAGGSLVFGAAVNVNVNWMIIHA
jgi:hypothetical protein